MSHNFIFIANNNIGYGLSGGDTIFIELIKNWQKQNKITLIGCQEAINILPPSINNISILTTDSVNNNTINSVINLFFHYLRRIFKGIITIYKHKNIFINQDFVYTVSDFLPDLIPGFIIKLLNPNIKWIAGFYLFAPHPFSKNSPYSGIHRFKGFIYWFIQLFSRYIVDKYADIIFVTSIPDISRFSKNKKVIVIRGGVDYQSIKSYIKKNPLKSTHLRKYDACFMGRFHPQKGCLKLIHIWYKVTKIFPQAKLAVIGQGEMESAMRLLVSKYNLKNNIYFFGFKVGKPKYKIFANSKVVVHPATYDSGGMASAEALAFGIPGVSFDLTSLKTYYSQGFLKSKCFSTSNFANNIIKLLSNKTLYKQLSQESLKLIESQWNWSKRAQEIFVAITYNQL